jgi:hypothetical protein
VNPRRICKVNVDDTTDKTIICTTTWNTTSAEEGNFAMQWVSMSYDGKYMVGGFPTYSQIAVFALNTSGQVTPQVYNNGYGWWLTTINANAQGCWPTMARDNTGDVLVTIGDHYDAMIATHDDKEISSWHTLSAIGMFECLRWTPDRNFLTCIKCCGTGVPGPYIVRISDNAVVYLNGSLSTLEGNMDVFFDTPSVVTNTQGTLGVRPVHMNGRDPCGGMFDLRGRSISGNGRIREGVYITTTIRAENHSEAAIVLGLGR